MQDVLEIEEYLWQYVEKYHAHNMQSIFDTGDVTYIYANDSFPHRLEIDGSNPEAVRTTTEEIVSLCQKVADRVAEETFPLPQNTDKDVLQTNIRDLVENEKMLLYVSHDGIGHIVGPKDKVSSCKQHILDVISVGVKKPETGDRNEKLTAPEARKCTLAPDTRYSMSTPGGIKVEIYQGNLVTETTDAIVSPSNSHLRHGSGAARAIADAAGFQLQKECRDFITQHGHLDVTRVMHTSAGNLKPNIQYVIHAVGPQAKKYPNAAELFQALVDTFFNCVRHADIELRVSSLSVPAISSGTCCLVIINQLIQNLLNFIYNSRYLLCDYNILVQ